MDLTNLKSSMMLSIKLLRGLRIWSGEYTDINKLKNNLDCAGKHGRIKMLILEVRSI